MDFVEIAINDIDGEAAETVSELFNKYGYGGAVIEAFPPHFKTVSVRTVLRHDDTEKRRELALMLTLVAKALPSGLPEPVYRDVGEADWANSWKENFHVVRIGQRFVIKPSWRDYTPVEGDLVIEIDPGMAFGSGLHPTTQLCLQILEAMPLLDQSLFDVGTGSAILSLAALKLGAGKVRAVDVDEIAVEVARENFEINGFTIDGRRIVTDVGSATNTGGQQWDIVVANILAHILIEIMADLTSALAPDGLLILSGIIQEQEPEMLSALQAHALDIVERHTEEDWVAFVVRARR